MLSKVLSSSVIGIEAHTVEVEVDPFVVDITETMKEHSVYEDDFPEVKGQEHAKRALEVAAAGGRNVLPL